ncbi:hypothetical protein CY35_03G031800 [Sphagnum magellanicum]|nr:hypothetical protein CY35_03G031800 [Sphagnum magellanicum]
MSSLFGSLTPQQQPTSSLFGSSLQNTFSQTPAFGQTQQSAGQSSTPVFGQTQSSIFGQTSGQQATGSLFGQTQSLFGQTPQTPTFGQTPQTPVFGQTQPQAQSSLFGGQPQQTSIFGQPQASQATFLQQQPSVLQSQPFGIPQQQSPFFNNAQITTQMAPIAPLVVPLPDREIQAIVDAYKDEPGNPQYAFKHLLLSVTDPAARVKPVGVSDIMWAEAMNKLEGMDSNDRERLWPELVHGFKDLSRRVKLQDEAITADVQRLQATEANVKLLRRHFETDTLPWIQRLHQKEQELQRRLLKVVRIVEALEGKGLHMTLTQGEAQLGDYLQGVMHQLQGASAELPRTVEALLCTSRMQVGVGGRLQSALLGPGKIENQSLAEMHEVLRQQTEAISCLALVLKRDMRDIEIITSKDTERTTGQFGKNSLRNTGSLAIVPSRKFPTRLL